VNEIAAPLLMAGAAAELDACRTPLRPDAPPDRDRARPLCRLSEALYYRNRHDDAVRCAQRALELQPDGDDILDFCGIMAQIPIRKCHNTVAELPHKGGDRVA
jgi:hypothetical protein